MTPVSKKALWAGRVLSGLSVAMLALDGISKLVRPMPAPIVEAFAQLGYSVNLSLVIGPVLLFCTVLYAVPRTSVLGALLLTGYLGGAIASNLRVGHPFFETWIFPMLVATLVWGGLVLRETRLRALLPLRS